MKKPFKVAIWIFSFMVIMGVLAVILIPGYCGPSPQRVKIMEGLALAASAKTAVSENATNGQAFATGWLPPEATKAVASITINPTNGIITITYTDEVAENSPTLLLIPTPDNKSLLKVGEPTRGFINWLCRSDAVQANSLFPHLLGTIPAIYTMANCRE